MTRNDVGFHVTGRGENGACEGFHVTGSEVTPPRGVWGDGPPEFKCSEICLWWLLGPQKDCKIKISTLKILVLGGSGGEIQYLHWIGNETDLPVLGMSGSEDRE